MGSFSPASSGRYYDIDITSLATLWRGGTANYGLIMKLATTNTLATYTSKEWATATQRPQLVVVTQPAPSFTMVASTSLVSDPFNNAVNPKAIPAAKARYTVSVSNSSAGSSDSGTAFTFPVPTGMDMCVGDIGAAGSGPVSFANGAVSSGLSYSYVSLASTTDSLAFSNNGGTSFGYTPAADPGGCDSNVTHVKVSPGGAFAAKTGATAPSLTLQMLMRVR
jgi:hypothetical protein